MDISLQHDSLRHADRLVRPWRLAAIVAAAIAAVELLLLVVVGGALLAKPTKGGAKHAAPVARSAHARPAHKAASAKAHRPAAAAAHLRRGQVKVLVLNGNGRQGAAGAAASRVSHDGYRVGGVANAPRMDFTRSLVMYRTGFEGEARRLARDMGVKIVGPLDGLRTSQLHGAHVVLVVGA